MPTVWPFKPRAELIEACEWLTDVVPSFASEERICLRETPIREFALTHVADQATQALARQIMRGDGVLLLPEWPRMVRADAYAGASVDLPDGPVLIWRSVTDHEQTAVTAGVLGAVAMPSNGVRILPLLTCRVVDDWSNSRPAGKWSEMALTVHTADGEDEADDSLYPMYQSIPLVTDSIVMGTGTADEGLTWENDTVDNGIALPTDVRASAYAAERYTVRWVKRDDAYRALRAWIYSRRGRWLPFWLPSWAVDMPNPAKSGSYLLADSFDPSETHIAAQIGGVLYPRKVLSASQVSGQWQLLLDTALPSGAIQRVMYLRLVRFNADRIEFRHAAAEGVAVAVQCVQIGTEYLYLQTENGLPFETESGDPIYLE